MNITSVVDLERKAKGNGFFSLREIQSMEYDGPRDIWGLLVSFFEHVSHTSPFLHLPFLSINIFYELLKVKMPGGKAHGPNIWKSFF